MNSTDLTTKLCYLNEKINKINQNLENKIIDTKEIFEANKVIANNQKEEINLLKANFPYTRTETDLIFATKEEVAGSLIDNTVTFDDVYTKTEADSSFVGINELETQYYPKAVVYTKTEVDTLFASDPNDYYSKVDFNSSIDISGASVVIKKKIVPSVTDTLDVGSPTLKFKDLYLGGSLHISNNELKADDVNGGIQVSNLVLGDNVSGKYKLQVQTVDSKKTIQIIDVDNIQSTINLTNLNDVIAQNNTYINEINDLLASL